MRTCICAIALLWGFILISEPVLADGCTYQTLTIDGKTRMCTTCCWGGTCNMSCS